VRTTPSRRSERIGVINVGTPFRLVAFERGWGKVLLKGTQSVGFVPGDDLRQVPDPPSKPAPAAAAAPGVTLEQVLVVDPDVMTVYVTPSGKRYHHADCRHVKDKGIPLQLSAAAPRYTPCRVCRPPEVE
jgi:hypothetical protein